MIRLAAGPGRIRTSTWRRSRRFARLQGGAIEHGTAHYYAGFSGVALWLPPGVAPDEASLVRVIQDTVAAAQQDAMFTMFERMEPTTPRTAPGISRSSGSIRRARTGIGAALLAASLSSAIANRCWPILKRPARGTCPYTSGTDLRALGSIRRRMRHRLSRWCDNHANGRHATEKTRGKKAWHTIANALP